jgi:hypothetical protein
MIPRMNERLGARWQRPAPSVHGEEFGEIASRY